MRDRSKPEIPVLPVPPPPPPAARSRRPHPEFADELPIGVDGHGRTVTWRPELPPYQFITGSWRDIARDVMSPPVPRPAVRALDAGLRFVRSLWERGGRVVRREPSLVDRRESARAVVQALGDQHHPDTALDLPGHPVPTIGCPWCIDGERAQRADDVLGALNPDEWYLLSAHTARYVLAIGDLVRERSL